MTDDTTAQYTPTTEDVRSQWTGSQTSQMSHIQVIEAKDAEFDRWLVAHDSEVTAAALSTRTPAAGDFMEETATHYANGEAKDWRVDNDLTPAPASTDDREALGDLLESEIAYWEYHMREGGGMEQPLANHLALALAAAGFTCGDIAKAAQKEDDQ